MDIVIVGSGNVATVMGRKMIAAGHRVIQVAGRNEATASQLALRLGALFTTDFSQLDKSASMYFIAIPDNALYGVGQWLNTGKTLTVHTAGSVTKNVLKEVSSNYGVIYPLQSMRADVEEIPEIPLLVDGSSAETLTLIHDFAESLSSMVEPADDDYRKKIHLAAVFTGNFSNHLFALCEKYCEKESLDFSLLFPLLKVLVERLQFYQPGLMQTGPAIRNDHLTIEKHLQMLDEYLPLKKIYEMMTSSIETFHGK
jgi:predicted short-subunit dehydrogenase-like oxidoreductase (DUF2520 family)